jgi:hypothetical protein
VESSLWYEGTGSYCIYNILVYKVSSTLLFLSLVDFTVGCDMFVSGICLEFVWNLFGICLEFVWNLN